MKSISGISMDNWLDSGLEDKSSILTVNCCGYQKFITKSFEIKRRNGRVDYQLIYIVNGKGIFQFDGSKTEITNGNIIIFKPGQPQLYNYFAKDSTEVFWIHFTGLYAHNYLQELGLLNHTSYYVGIIEEISILFRKIINELNTKKYLYENVTSAHFLEILSLFGRRLLNVGDKRKSENPTDIKKVIETMHERYNQNLVISELAKECSLSLFRFIHKFKSVTGMTPVEYITGVRLNEAKKLLSESSLNVSEVASIVGYENPLYFSRVFKKCVGVPPSQFKKGCHQR